MISHRYDFAKTPYGCEVKRPAYRKVCGLETNQGHLDIQACNSCGRDSPETNRSSQRLLRPRIVSRDLCQIRRLPPPEPGVANVDGGSLFDPRITVPTWRFGPFGPEMIPEINELIAQHNEPFSSPVFTHGDLSSLNILARGDQVVGIVDWETAGWFPSYWEYTTACQVNPQNSFWIEEIDKFLEPFPMEQAMEKTRQKYFGDF